MTRLCAICSSQVVNFASGPVALARGDQTAPGLLEQFVGIGALAQVAQQEAVQHARGVRR
jgi:hypothetical protein